MNVSIDVEAEGWHVLPGLEALTEQACAAAAESLGGVAGELSVLFTSDAEIARLNQEWRKKAGPTNVLSFPAPRGIPVPPGEVAPLGDLVLACETVNREAIEQDKSLAAHTAHLIVHGCLHILGYDHLTDAEAEAMETREIRILGTLGIGNPYLEANERP